MQCLLLDVDDGTEENGKRTKCKIGKKMVHEELRDKIAYKKNAKMYIYIYIYLFIYLFFIYMINSALCAC